MKSRITNVRRAVVAVSGFVSAIGLVASTPGVANASKVSAKTLTTVNYGVVGISVTDLPLFVATDQGYFRKNGLVVNLIAVGQSQPICQQLIAGALQLGSCSLSDTIQARTSGGAIELIDNELSTALPYDLVVSKSITSWAQLVGKTVMLGGPRDNTVYYFSLMAKKAGYKLSDFSYTYSGASGNRFAALQSGSVAGTLLTLPYAPAAEAIGYNHLSSLSKLLNAKTYAGGGTDVNIAYAKSHPKVLRGYMKSYQEAMTWIYNPKNKAKVLKVIEVDGGTPASVAQITYDELVATHYFSRTGQIFRSALKGTEMSLYSLGFLTGKPPTLSNFYTGKFAK